MSFRGLDFSPGLNRYSDLIRQAYGDTQQSVNQQFERGAKYGTELPGYMMVDNPFYLGGHIGPTQGSPLEPGPMQPGMQEEAPPPGMVPYNPKAPQSMNQQEQGRSPAGYQQQAASAIFNQEAHNSKLRAMQLANAERLMAKGEMPSQAEIMMQQISTQPKIHPHLLTQVYDLQQKLASQNQMANLISALKPGGGGVTNVNLGDKNKPNKDPLLDLQRRINIFEQERDNLVKTRDAYLPKQGMEATARGKERWLKSGSTDAVLFKDLDEKIKLKEANLEALRSQALSVTAKSLAPQKTDTVKTISDPIYDKIIEKNGVKMSAREWIKSGKATKAIIDGVLKLK